MARITPVKETDLQPSLKIAFERHIHGYEDRITNTKATLGHSLPAFEAYMQWYPLYQEIEKILGKRLAYLFAYSISEASGCSLCAAFFRKIIIEAGERTDQLMLTASQRNVLEFGASIARYKGNIANHVYDAVALNYTKADMVVLIAFAGQMIATNIFNNVVETDVDQYLEKYQTVLKYR
ncbi:MAG: hypothetical protein ABI480_02925 [Chitinophagaceae bacterium]